jgi:hypothetical protein
MHEHSAYSDGYPTTRPADFYAAGRRHGLDFMGGSDHSDTLGVAVSASNDCANDPSQTGCAVADTVNPLDSLRKWAATAEQAVAATSSSFTAVRGFEWTSDRFGHINVYFSDVYRNAKDDGGYAAMETFYTWLGLPAEAGGGADGLATFNHPGSKKLSTSDPAYNWNDFAYVPSADDQMVGIEVYNGDDYAAPGAHNGPPEGWYVHALDKGWHLGAVGAEDLGHHRGDDWGGPLEPKTVMLSTDRSAPALRTAMTQRRFYAVRTPDYRMSYTVDGEPMGSRLTRSAGSKVRFAARAKDAAGNRLLDSTLELVTRGGQVVATGEQGKLEVKRGASATEDWYFVRARRDGQVIAYSSPVWVTSS